MLPAMKNLVLPLKTPYFTVSPDQMKDYMMGVWNAALDQLPKCDPVKGPWIAGGAVRRFLLGADPFEQDIDYFCLDKQQHTMICSRLEVMGAVVIQSTKDHVTYELILETDFTLLEEDVKVKVQVVKSRFRPTLEAHPKEFDFTICQTGWNGKEFLLSLKAYNDLSEKSLKLAGTMHNVAGSWMRVLKYYKQGFEPTKPTLMQLLEQAKDQVDESDLSY